MNQLLFTNSIDCAYRSPNNSEYAPWSIKAEDWSWHEGIDELAGE
jgi:hypothetical protein